jgi:AcrR family transcriptional regulator
MEGSAGQRRPGRPRDQDREAAIMRAALEGLAELGYDRLSMEEIAARARSGKGALYRRWPSKAALVADAVLSWRTQLAPMAAPDTGSLLGDLEAIVASVPDFGPDEQRELALVVGLVTAAGRDPDLQAALVPLMELPRRLIREVLEHAVARQEIAADRDLELVPDLLIGLNMTRVVQGLVPDRDFVRRVLLAVVHPLVTAPTTRAPS